MAGSIELSHTTTPKRGRPRKMGTTINENYLSHDNNMVKSKTYRVKKKKLSKYAAEGRLLMKDWLVKNTNNGLPGLEWHNEEKTMIRIEWKHASRQDWDPSENSVVFREWADYTGRFDADSPDDKKYKATFRVGLSSLSDVKIVKHLCKRGKQAYVVYKLSPKTPKSKTNRRKKGRPKHDESTEPNCADIKVKEHSSQLTESGYFTNNENHQPSPMGSDDSISDFGEQVSEINSPTSTSALKLKYPFDKHNSDIMTTTSKPEIPRTVTQFDDHYIGFRNQSIMNETSAGECSPNAKTRDCESSYSDTVYLQVIQNILEQPQIAAQVADNLQGSSPDHTSDYHSASSGHSSTYNDLNITTGIADFVQGSTWSDAAVDDVNVQYGVTPVVSYATTLPSSSSNDLQFTVMQPCNVPYTNNHCDAVQATSFDVVNTSTSLVNHYQNLDQLSWT